MTESRPPPSGVRRAPFTTRERWTVVAVAAAPVVLAVVVLVPVAAVTGASAADVVVAAIVYGGLLGLAAGFVAVDRLQARQCPRCTCHNVRGAPACDACGYDLVHRPLYACSEQHATALEPGLCQCGRRLERLEVARGIGREVRFMLRAGLWLLGFLVAVGIVLRLLAR